jgi:hypothetical protein
MRLLFFARIDFIRYAVVLRLGPFVWFAGIISMDKWSGEEFSKKPYDWQEEGDMGSPKSSEPPKSFAGDVSAWDLLVGGDEIVHLLDFLIERLEQGESTVEALKALREKVESERTSSWPKR